LRDIDDVQSVAERNAGSRAAGAAAAERILEAELERFEAWLAALEVVPAIAALRARGDQVAERVLAENENRWKDLCDEDRERVAAIVGAVVSRLLHTPTRRLRDVAGTDRAYEMVSAMRELFDLDTETSAPLESDASVTPIRKTEG
jgi:glutamyl-tRNA reductase